jgi:hypothetical protein
MAGTHNQIEMPPTLWNGAPMRVKYVVVTLIIEKARQNDEKAPKLRLSSAL